MEKIRFIKISFYNLYFYLFKYSIGSKNNHIKGIEYMKGEQRSVSHILFTLCMD
jgi:hypothetical protein